VLDRILNVGRRTDLGAPGFLAICQTPIDHRHRRRDWEAQVVIFSNRQQEALNDGIAGALIGGPALDRLLGDKHPNPCAAARSSAVD
jgi:hypothetical protein